MNRLLAVVPHRISSFRRFSSNYSRKIASSRFTPSLFLAGAGATVVATVGLFVQQEILAGSVSLSFRMQILRGLYCVLCIEILPANRLLWNM